MISTAIFTYNEEVNLPHCLGSLKECDDIIVVDSFSTDGTVTLARKGGCRVFQHEFTGFGDQRMWALNTIAFKHPWVLILDADERVTPELWNEMIKRTNQGDSNLAAFQLKRRFYWEGAWLKYANLYPSWIVRLIRVGKVRYINRGHAETQEVEGAIESLVEDLIDENHKGLEEWRQRQRKYAAQEAEYEIDCHEIFSVKHLFSQDPLVKRQSLKSLGRLLPLRGFFYFLYVYFIRSGWRDGRIGYKFCLEKARFQNEIQRLKKC